MESLSLYNYQQDSRDETSDVGGKDSHCKSDEKYKTDPPHRDINSDFDDEIEVLYVRCNVDRLSDEANDSGNTGRRPKCTSDGKYKTVLPFRDSDMDFAVGNSDETVSMKAKRNNDPKVFAASLRFKLLSAVEDEKEDRVKSLLDEFLNASYMKSWNSDSDPENKEGKFEIWRDAMYIAMGKKTKLSEEIMKLLLDSDIISSLETKRDNPLLHQLIRIQLHEEGIDDKMLCLIELLLQSGRINVNAKDEDGRTALHRTTNKKVISLLIRYGADVNEKDNEGMTSLMKPKVFVNRDSVLSLRSILEEAGTSVDLNATDCRGRTALMFAVIYDLPDVVELFLNAGVSVNLSDHLGFTALHYALFMNKFGDIVQDYDHFPRNSEELKKRKEIFAQFFDAIYIEGLHKNCNWYKRFKNWYETKKKIGEMLLRRPDIDVNALNLEKFSPMDIAEAWLPEIPSSIKNALKEKGAVLNAFAFQHADSQSTNEFYLDARSMLILQRLADQIFEDEILDLLKDRLRASFETFRDQLVSGKDQQRRTALHLAAISCSIISGRGPRGGIPYTRTGLADAIVKELISFGCCVNASDIYGRTPLHYADDELQDLLISKGADASIRDKEGNSAINKTSRKNDKLRSADRGKEIVKALYTNANKMRFLHHMKNRKIEINVQSSSDAFSVHSGEELYPKEVPKLLWENGEYALRHPLVEQITKEVKDLMDAVAKEMENLDPRFGIRLEFVGSSNEGTKIEKPDEFDVCFILTKISEFCEVSQSPELPTGFVHLKRKRTKVDEISDFDSFFGKYGILNPEKLNWQFRTILNNAVVNIENQQSFDCNLEMQQPGTDMTNTIMRTIITPYFQIKKVSTIKMVKTQNSTTVDLVSIDIVPCIHIDGWWPDEAIYNVSDEIKNFGCNLAFDSPQKIYPWVPYSESCARISFSKAESDKIKLSCVKAKEAYMVGKTMINKLPWNHGYILKNCLLYCIEALTPTSEKASQLGLSLEEMESKFRQVDRYLWLKCLMKCHLEFVSQDFCPCYFLPNFSSPIPIANGYLKKSSRWMNDSYGDIPYALKRDCAFYSCASTDASESCYQLPAPDPLWERFDRDLLFSRLFKIAYK